MKLSRTYKFKKRKENFRRRFLKKLGIAGGPGPIEPYHFKPILMSSPYIFIKIIPSFWYLFSLRLKISTP
jgi:hypothetical protein